jgi:hypothetical protein
MNVSNSGFLNKYTHHLYAQKTKVRKQRGGKKKRDVKERNWERK